MQKKTIQKVLSNKMESWIKSIKDESLRKEVKDNLLVSGGSIASLFLNENVNDFDVYIQDMSVLYRLCKYYCMEHSVEVLDGREKEKMMQSEFGWVNSDDDFYSEKGEKYSSMRYVSLKTLKENQIKLYVGGGKRIEYKDEVPEYAPLFFSPNAISLSNDVQIVCRFHGNEEQIHQTFDFVHATNYFTFKEGLVTNLKAMESLITKQLMYQGSLYPLTSIIRTKKFIKRNWNIGAGEQLKIMFQISELDLTNPETLEEQLIGVDVAYFSLLIEAMRTKLNKDKDFKITYCYIRELIDRVFNETEEDI